MRRSTSARKARNLKGFETYPAAQRSTSGCRPSSSLETIMTGISGCWRWQNESNSQPSPSGMLRSLMIRVGRAVAKSSCATRPFSAASARYPLWRRSQTMMSRISLVSSTTSTCGASSSSTQTKVRAPPGESSCREIMPRALAIFMPALAETSPASGRDGCEIRIAPARIELVASATPAGNPLTT